MLNQLKILFFIAGAVPTLKDQIEASEISGAKVCFRNALYVDKYETSLETCDGVAGCVPEAYSKLPTAEAAIAARREALLKLRAKLGDVPAPKPLTAKEQAEAAKALKKAEEEAAKAAEQAEKEEAAKALTGNQSSPNARPKPTPSWAPNASA